MGKSKSVQRYHCSMTDKHSEEMAIIIGLIGANKNS